MELGVLTQAWQPGRGKSGSQGSRMGRGGASEVERCCLENTLMLSPSISQQPWEKGGKGHHSHFSDEDTEARDRMEGNGVPSEP